MNRVFSRVWSRSLQALVVASELAASSGRKAGRTHRQGVSALGALLLSASFVLTHSAHAADSPAAGDTTDAVCADTAPAGAQQMDPAGCEAKVQADAGVMAVVDEA